MTASASATSAPAATASSGPASSGPAASRRLATAIVAGFCLLALGGYGLFLLSDRPDPVPAYPPASFGLSVAGTTDPAAFQVVEDIELIVRELDTAEARINWQATFQSGTDGGDDPARPVAGTILVALPIEATVVSVGATAFPEGIAALHRAGPESVPVVIDPELVNRIPDRPTKVGVLAGQPMTALPDSALPGGAPRARLFQIPVVAEQGAISVQMELAAPPAIFATPERAGETAFAVEFGTTAAALRAAPDARPLAEYATAAEPATIELRLGYDVELTEMEITAVPQVARMEFGGVVWAEEVIEDGRLRVDGVLVDMRTRYWLDLLDNGALLLLGAMVAVLIDRLRTR